MFIYEGGVQTAISKLIKVTKLDFARHCFELHTLNSKQLSYKILVYL